jgi:hypothetical protein
MKLKEITCRSVREALGVAPDSATALSTVERQHLASCKECQAFLADLKHLNMLMEYPIESSADALRGRIKRRIDAEQPRRWRESELRIPPKAVRFHAGWAVVLLIAGIVLFGISVRFVRHGTKMSAQWYVGEAADAMDRMDTAIARIHNAYVVTWATDYTTDHDTVHHHFATLQKIEEMWYQDGRWRKEGLWGSRLIIGHPATYTNPARPVYGTYYRFDHKAHRVVSMDESGKQWEDFTFEGVTMMDTGGGKRQSVTVGYGRSHGHTTREVALTRTGETGSRVLCWVDTITSLPVTVEFQSMDGRNWKTRTRFDFEFNQNLPQSLFDPSSLKDEGWSMRG